MSLPGAMGAPTASPEPARSYRVLVVTNLWPTEADPSYGAAIRAQMESLQAFGVNYNVVFVNGRASKLNYLRGIFEVRQRIAAQSFDLIYAHFGLSGWVARFQWKLPVVVKFMGDDVLGQFDWRGRITLMGRFYQVSSFVLARLVEGVIVISEAMKRTLRLKKARVITVGVNLELFKPMDRNEARRALGLDENKKYVLFPCDRTIARKRFDLVQEAVKLARAEVPELEILQVYGVPQQKMPLYFNAADVFVLVSEAESGPNTLKEAMAVNLPAVAVDVGDVVQTMGSAEGNYVVPRDPAAVAEKIVLILRQRIVSHGREHLGKHTLQGMGRKVIDVFDSVMTRADGRL